MQIEFAPDSLAGRPRFKEKIVGDVDGFLVHSINSLLKSSISRQYVKKTKRFDCNSQAKKECPRGFAALAAGVVLEAFKAKGAETGQVRANRKPARFSAIRKKAA